MIRKFVQNDAHNWNKQLKSRLLAVWKVLQAPMGFSSFKLYLGCKSWGILDVIKENWEGNCYEL